MGEKHIFVLVEFRAVIHTVLIHVCACLVMYTSVNATQQCLSFILSSCLHVQNHCPASITMQLSTIVLFFLPCSLPSCLPGLFFSWSGSSTQVCIMLSLVCPCSVRLNLPIMPQFFIPCTKVLQQASVVTKMTWEQAGNEYMIIVSFVFILVAWCVWQSPPVCISQFNDRFWPSFCFVCMPAKQQFLLNKKWEYVTCDNASIQLEI